MILKVVLSVLAWLAATLISAAGIEVAFGRSRPGFVPIVTMFLLVPTLILIWRRRPGTPLR